MNWHDYFEYKDGKLYWKVKNGSKHEVGSEVGSSDGSGYIRTTLHGKKERVHRIVWEMFYGEIPKGLWIDHINQIKTDNRVENLRIVEPRINARNCKISNSNTSGFTGVYWHKKSNKWRAAATVNGKSIHLGLFLTIEDAIFARERFNSENGFHENHGGRNE